MTGRTHGDGWEQTGPVKLSCFTRVAAECDQCRCRSLITCRLVRFGEQQRSEFIDPEGLLHGCIDQRLMGG